MKKFIIGLIAVISILGLLSCENNNTLDPQSGDIGAYSLTRRDHGHDNPAPCSAIGEFAGINELNSHYAVYDYTLWAREDSSVGSVSITNDSENIYVTYTTIESQKLDEVHVNVWTSLDDIPDNPPSPSHADYSQEDINAFSTTVVIPADFACGDSYYIVAQARLYEVSDDEEDDEEDDDEDDEDEEDEDEDEDENDSHGHDNGHGRGHYQHGQGHGYGHDNEGMQAYAGDDASPDCFAAMRPSFWGYVEYSIECFASISGRVYEDANSSGAFDAGDAGFEGLLVTASGSDGSLYSALSTVDGSYLFDALPAGFDYTLISAAPQGDFEASENASGYLVSNLFEDLTEINFGFGSAIVLSDCGISSTLWTGDFLDVGTVSIANDADNLYITFDTNELADLAAVHVDVIALDAGRNVGVPADYLESITISADVFTVTIPFAMTEFTCSDLMVIKALAVLASEDSSLEGAFAWSGENYGSTRAGWYGDIEFDSCCPVLGPQ